MHIDTHAHSHAPEKTGCSCCTLPPAAEDKQIDSAMRREILLLVSCAFLFFSTLAASDWIAETFGIWTLRGLYFIPYALCGFSIFLEAFAAIRKGEIFNEFTLMCGATIAAAAIGQLPEAVGVMLFYRIGEFFQDRAAAGSRRSIRNLLASRPTEANVISGDTITPTPVESVAPGTLVQVRAGEKIPLDGEVAHGESQVDQSPLTGESVPVHVGPQSPVLGGSINGSGVLTVRVTSCFADTHIARILHMVENAAQNKSPTERFITRFARYYTPAVVAAAFLIALLPPLLVDGQTFSTWLYRALVMLVISCPCALLISIPLSYFGGIGAASRNGILIKGGQVLDGLLHIDTVVFDKTGTLTKGVFEVTRLVPAAGVTEEELLAAAVTAERSSNHPAARSIIAFARAKGMSVPAAGGDAREVCGKGMEVQEEGARYLAGTAALLADHGIASEDFDHPGTLVHIAKDDRLLGTILVSDVIRPESREAVATLSALGMKTWMLSGDRKPAAEWAAKELNLDGHEAELMPEGKVEAMRRLSDSSRTAFVGDGINDAPILALSRVGIAMGGIGAEAAVEAADAVVLNDSPESVVRLFTLARKVRVIVKQNIVLALGVKLTFMALGAFGLSSLWEAVFADVGVALLAVLNAGRAVRQ